jgi:hypothetical protein
MDNTSAPWRSHEALVIISIWLVVTAFNITKAAHMDDTAYLEIARHILVDPLHPISARYAPLMKKQDTISVSADLAIYLRLQTKAGGYYSASARALPWHFSTQPLEQFTILKITET